ncbi:UNVERIFIED_CONTAM: hypothetical protein ABIC26_004287 [Paenibacillus sp. PvR008]
MGCENFHSTRIRPWALCLFISSRCRTSYYNPSHKNKITLIEKLFEQEELCSYLDTIVSKRIYKEGQKQVIEKFDIKDYRGRLQKDISQLQSYLQSNQLKYAIGSFPDNRKKLEDGSNNPHKGRRYWLVSKFNG